MGPVRDLGDEAEGAVALDVGGAGGARQLLGGIGPEPFEVVIGVPHVDAAEDGGGVARGVGGLGLSGGQRDAERGGDVVEEAVQRGRRPVQVVVDAARLTVVQCGEKTRAGLVEQAHEGLGLGQDAVEVGVLVGEGEGPFDLLLAGGAVEVASVAVLVGRGGEPALVEPCPVGVDAGHDVPCSAEVGAQRGVLAQGGGQVQRGHGAHRLVGVDSSDDDVRGGVRVVGGGAVVGDREAV